MRSLRLAIIALGAAAPVAAGPLPGWFACTDWDGLDVAAGTLEAQLLETPGLACRELRLRQGSAVECDADPPVLVGGLPAREVGAASDADGTRRVRAVLRASASRLRDATASRLGLRFEAVDAQRWIARDPAHPRRRVEVLAREDGAALLVCALDPPRDVAAEFALGIDAARGGIAGRVAWPDGGKPALRVCAVPREPTLRAGCVDRAAGQDDFLLTGLAPGDYDVIAFAMDDDGTRRAVAAHANPLEDCASDAPGCASGLLVPVTVRAGMIATDIDADRTFTRLPPRFDEVRPR